MAAWSAPPPLRVPAFDDSGAITLVRCRSAEAFLPVVLTAAHGGDRADGDQAAAFAERPEGAPGVRTLQDYGTAALLEAIDARVLERTGQACHSVIARFHRMYVDANRSLDDPEDVAVAPGCAAAARAHDRYHRAVAGALARLTGGHRHGRVLLLDIHGQARHPKSVLIGTRNGATADLAHLHAPGEGFLWHLRRLMGDAVLPARGQPEFPDYMGGYTVHRHCGFRIDAVQLEFGASWRREPERRAAAAELVATAIVNALQPLVPFVAAVAAAAAAAAAPAQPAPPPPDAPPAAAAASAAAATPSAAAAAAAAAAAPWSPAEQRAVVHKLLCVGATTPATVVRLARAGALNSKLTLCREAPLPDAVLALMAELWEADARDG